MYWYDRVLSASTRGNTDLRNNTIEDILRWYSKELEVEGHQETSIVEILKNRVVPF
jgi:hypothetical protein